MGTVANFLTSLFNTARTAGEYGQGISFGSGRDPWGIRGWTHGVKRLLPRPVNPSDGAEASSDQVVGPPWDMKEVLEALMLPPFELMSSCPLFELSVKTAFLLAAASARRRSAIHALSILPGHMRFEPHGVRLVPDPSFLAKNQTADFLPAPIFLAKIDSFSSISEDKVWCPVRALRHYLRRTAPLRGSCTALFIVSRRPFGRASRDTISRWIVNAIGLSSSGSTGPRPRAHQVRAMSTSMALYKGVPLEEILQAAAWKSSNTFISSYLRDVLCLETWMASAFVSAPGVDAGGHMSSSVPTPR